MPELQRSKISIWIEALRLRTLPLSVAGIVTGSALAFEISAFKWTIFIPAIITTLLLQILSNLANDYGDGVKGTDDEDRIGPVRMTSSGLLSNKEIVNSILLVSIMALLSGIALLYASFGPENFIYALVFFILGLLSIWAAIKYTVGKSAYGYYGLGDLFVLVFFGFVSVAGSFFLYTQDTSISAILQSISIGGFSTGVLHLNNMRDQKSDAAAGKTTLAVKLGERGSKVYFLGLILLATGGGVLDMSLTSLHFTELLPILILAPMLLLMLKVLRIKNHADYNRFLKPLALSTFIYSLLLFASIAL